MKWLFKCFEIFVNNVLKGNIDKVLTNNIFHSVANNIWIVITLLIGLILFKVVAMSLTFGGGGVGGVGVGLSPPLLHPAKDSTIKLSAMMLFFLIITFNCCINYNLTILN